MRRRDVLGDGMEKHFDTGRNAPVTAPGLDPEYRPAIDGHAKRLIARIQKDNQDTEAVLELAAHYSAHADYPSLANLMEGWAHTLRDERRACAAYVRAGEAVLNGLADRRRAQTLFQRALERCPDDEAALHRLEALLREQGDDTGLERCLSQLIAELERRGAASGTRAKLHYQLGRLYEERLLLRGRAIAQYRAAVELDPTLVPAISAARGIYLNSGKMEAAADMFELQISAMSEPTDRHALLVALAHHRREALADLDGAVLALRRAVKTLPAEPPTLELLAELLVKRAGAGGDGAHADRSRAAELYYQIARSVPRNQAAPSLHACLALHPEHARARRMLAELNAYGAQIVTIQSADETLSQAEIDTRATGSYGIAGPPDVSQTLPGPVPMLAEASEDAAAQDDMAAWLDDADVTMLEDSVSTQNMVPLSDRPPPPESSTAPALRGDASTPPPPPARGKRRWPN
jgi:tetratricopeptide (TPR) repeat protein